MGGNIQARARVGFLGDVHGWMDGWEYNMEKGRRTTGGAVRALVGRRRGLVIGHDYVLLVTFMITGGSDLAGSCSRGFVGSTRAART